MVPNKKTEANVGAQLDLHPSDNSCRMKECSRVKDSVVGHRLFTQIEFACRWERLYLEMMKRFSARGILAVLLGIFMAISWSVPTSVAENHLDQMHHSADVEGAAPAACDECNEDEKHTPATLCFSVCMHLAPSTNYSSGIAKSVDTRVSFPIDEGTSPHRVVSPEPPPPNTPNTSD